MGIVPASFTDPNRHHDGGFSFLTFSSELIMRVNMKSLTVLFFTGLCLQAFVFSNISASPAIMKLSPFYNPNGSMMQPVFSNLASTQAPSRH